MLTAYVGFTTEANPEWLGFLPKPVAPANYKDEDKIRAYIAQAEKKQLEEAAKSPLCGLLKNVCAVVGTEPVTTVGVGVFDVLCSVQCVVGFRVFDLLDLLIVDAIDRVGELPERYRWAKVGKMIKTNYLPDDTGRLNPKVILDPASVLIGEYEDKDLPQIMQRFGTVFDVQTTAPGRAWAARSLAKKLGL